MCFHTLAGMMEQVLSLKFNLVNPEYITDTALTPVM